MSLVLENSSYAENITKIGWRNIANRHENILNLMRSKRHIQNIYQSLHCHVIIVCFFAFVIYVLFTVNCLTYCHSDRLKSRTWWKEEIKFHSLDQVLQNLFFHHQGTLFFAKFFETLAKLWNLDPTPNSKNTTSTIQPRIVNHKI